MLFLLRSQRSEKQLTRKRLCIQIDIYFPDTTLVETTRGTRLKKTAQPDPVNIELRPSSFAKWLHVNNFMGSVK